MEASIDTANSEVKQRRFIPLTLVDSSVAMELLHPLGYQIRFHGEVEATALKNILDVLDGRSRR
jgi:hypothetical protein